jgi:hypothetical protein
VKFRFSIRVYALAVVHVASLATLYKIGVWAIRTYIHDHGLPRSVA